jgi:L-malate glycosyltransferase
LNIAFVSDAVYPWNIGGLETLEYAEAKELAKTNNVHFFSLQWEGMGKDFAKDNIVYHTMHKITLDKFYRHNRRSIREAILYSLSLYRLFFYNKESKFDYIQANEFPILHIPLLKLYCKLTGCKLIIDMFEIWDENYWISYLGTVTGLLASAYASWAIKGADAYIACSSTTANKLESLGINKEEIHQFAPVITKDKFLHSHSGKSKLVIFCGRIIKEKRLDKWLLAFKSARNQVKAMKGIIIGSGDKAEEAAIRKQINELGLNGIVIVMNFFEDKQQLYKEIKEAKLMLHMSEREGLSIIVLESIALGTPVLLPDYSPIPKEIKDMCVVEMQVGLVDKMVEMLNAKDKSKYIKNTENLNMFSSKNVNNFYSNLFKELSI